MLSTIESVLSLKMTHIECGYICRWNLEDDQLLYEGVKANIPIETLCITLKRGYQGVKSRIRHLNDPKHKAYMRLFGTEGIEHIHRMRFYVLHLELHRLISHK